MSSLETQATSFVSLYVIGLVFWVTIVLIREKQGKDNTFMRRQTLPCCNNWCISHFLHYFALGYLAPSYWKLALALGILFEVAEIPLSFFSQYVDSKPLADPITNSVGLYFGVLLSKYIPLNVGLHIPGSSILVPYLPLC